MPQEAVQQLILVNTSEGELVELLVGRFQPFSDQLQSFLKNVEIVAYALLVLYALYFLIKWRQSIHLHRELRRIREHLETLSKWIEKHGERQKSSSAEHPVLREHHPPAQPPPQKNEGREAPPVLPSNAPVPFTVPNRASFKVLADKVLYTIKFKIIGSKASMKVAKESEWAKEFIFTEENQTHIIDMDKKKNDHLHMCFKEIVGSAEGLKIACEITHVHS